MSGQLNAQFGLDLRQAQAAIAKADADIKKLVASLEQADAALVETSTASKSAGTAINQLSSKTEKHISWVQKARAEDRQNAYAMRQSRDMILLTVFAMMALSNSDENASKSQRAFNKSLMETIMAFQAVGFVMHGLQETGGFASLAARLGMSTGGLGIAIAAVVSAGIGLVSFFKQSNEEAGKAAKEGLKDFVDRLKDMSPQQITVMTDVLEQRIKDLQNIQKQIVNLPARGWFGETSNVWEKIWGVEAISPEVQEQIKFYQGLLDSINALSDTTVDKTKEITDMAKARATIDKEAMDRAEHLREAAIDQATYDKYDLEYKSAKQKYDEDHLSSEEKAAKHREEEKKAHDEIISKEKEKVNVVTQRVMLNKATIDNEIVEYQNMLTMVQSESERNDILIKIQGLRYQEKKDAEEIANSKKEELMRQAELALIQAKNSDYQDAQVEASIETLRSLKEQVGTVENLNDALLYQAKLEEMIKELTGAVTKRKEDQARQRSDDIKNMNSYRIVVGATQGALSGLWSQLEGGMRQAKDAWDAMWLGMERTAIRVIEDIVMKWIESQLETLFLNILFPGLGIAAGAIAPKLGDIVARGGYGSAAEGGYTGPGERHEVAGVVHRGEVVFEKPIVDKVGVNRLLALREQLQSTISPHRYMNGGEVEQPPIDRTEFIKRIISEQSSADRTEFIRRIISEQPSAGKVGTDRLFGLRTSLQSAPSYSIPSYHVGGGEIASGSGINTDLVREMRQLRKDFRALKLKADRSGLWVAWDVENKLQNKLQY